jgi:stress response protein YsnF
MESLLAFSLQVATMKPPRETVPGVNMQDRATFESAIVQSVLNDAHELHERARQTLQKSAEALKMAKVTIKLLESAVTSSGTA